MKDVWAVLCEKHGTTGCFIWPNDDSKDQYFASLSKTLLNHIARNYQKVTLNHLFAATKCFGNQAEDVSIVPLRHAQHFKSSPPYTDSELVALILKTTNYHPKTLHVMCGLVDSAMHSGLWQSTDRVLLKTYLSHTSTLTVRFCPYGAFDFAFLFSVLQNKHQLKRLGIVDDYDTFESFIDTIGKYEITSLNVLDIEVQNSYNEWTSLFDIGSHVSDWATLELSRIISAQSSLHKCSLDINLPTLGPPLYRALANLLQQPQFCELALRRVRISLPDLQQIVSAFVMASRTILALDITVIAGYFVLSDVPQLPRDAKLTNELSLAMNHLPNSFLVWLSQVPLHLKRLMLHNGAQILPFVSEHPALIVEELDLFGSCSGVTQCFRQIQDLKQLTLAFMICIKM